MAAEGNFGPSAAVVVDVQRNRECCLAVVVKLYFPTETFTLFCLAIDALTLASDLAKVAMVTR